MKSKAVWSTINTLSAVEFKYLKLIVQYNLFGLHYYFIMSRRGTIESNVRTEWPLILKYLDYRSRFTSFQYSKPIQFYLFCIYSTEQFDCKNDYDSHFRFSLKFKSLVNWTWNFVGFFAIVGMLSINHYERNIYWTTTFQLNKLLRLNRMILRPLVWSPSLLHYATLVH